MTSPLPSPRAALLAVLLAALPLGRAAAAQGAPPDSAVVDLAILGGVPPLYLGSVDVADYDRDGRPDLLVSGTDGEAIRTRVYRYVEETVEVLPMGAVRITAVYAQAQPSVDIPQVWGGEAVWGDYDGDGAADILLTGAASLEPPYAPVTRLYANRGGALVEVPSATQVLVPVSNSTAAWGDVDGDGDLDAVVAGRAADGTRRTDLYRNDGRGAFTRLEAGLVGVEGGDVDWGDVDGDGDLDLALVGVTDAGAVARIYRNDGGAFTPLGADLPGLLGGTVDWGDLEGDGDLDLLLAGGVLAPTIAEGTARVYRNDGGTFTALPRLRGALGTRALWADIDGDGDLDVTVAGPSTATADETYSLRFYTNEGGTLTETGRYGGVVSGDAVWYDYNGDGHLDLLQMGLLGGRPDALLFRQSVPPPDDDEEDGGS